MTRTTEGLADYVIECLMDRKGFDYWWNTIEFETQDEIIDNLQESIEEFLDEEE